MAPAVRGHPPAVAAALACALLPGVALCLAPTPPAQRLRARAAALLSTAAGRLESADLAVLARQTAGGRDAPVGLDRVKDMIREMIDRKQSDLTESVSHKQFCDGELKQASMKLKDLQMRLEKQTADRDKLEAEMADLGDHAADLRDSEVEVRRGMAAASEARSKEHDSYMEGKRKYESGPPPSNDAALKERIKVETEEAARDLEFRRKEQQALDTIKEHAATAQRSTAQVSKMRLDLAEANRDIQDLQELLASAKDYKAQVDRQCIVRVEPAAERKRRRNQEIASLKDAYEILAG